MAGVAGPYELEISFHARRLTGLATGWYIGEWSGARGEPVAAVGKGVGQRPTNGGNAYTRTVVAWGVFGNGRAISLLALDVALPTRAVTVRLAANPVDAVSGFALDLFGARLSYHQSGHAIGRVATISAGALLVGIATLTTG